ncbi:tRNA (N6-threonylcarbamoyladenosine(37)-N6)-methyltransferase TrmO [Candidatus Bathyarchaeota archaeon]|mgnify:CR=1 FL=1|nr:MAG: tRNA (N6-threonylcarbamoyladenosine(37)-N6)-methyltransferase TrmO [Candidatus Bathyarchaeota archaeon]
MECKIIGTVKSPVTEAVDMNWGEVISEIVLEPEYAPGLLGLEDFSHLMVLTFLHEAEYNPEKHLRRHPQERQEMPLLGIFAQRARHRPNRIGVTAVEIVEVTDNSVKVHALDAIDGTPVIDIKPYVPVYDKKDATIPEWMEKMMKGYF